MQARASPLLERRIQNLKSTANNMPVIHVHVPGSSITNPPSNHLFAANAPSTSASAAVPSITGPSKLLTCITMGPDISIDNFCQIYDLSDDICQRLKTNGYPKTKTLRHITLQQLQEMSFRHGEIASLQDAVDEWAVSLTEQD
jgi:hypothetical protein